jgi:hypothetical protein
MKKIGFGNYNHGLTEPSLGETLDLIAVLEEWKIKVYRKTIREATQKNTEEHNHD